MGKLGLMILMSFAGVLFGLFSGSPAPKALAAQKSGDSCDRKEHQPASSNHQSPFACDRLALDPEARNRHFDELGPSLCSMRKAVRELPNGYESQFPADPKI